MSIHRGVLLVYILGSLVRYKTKQYPELHCRLKSNRGLAVVPNLFENVKFKGKGYEVRERTEFSITGIFVCGHHTCFTCALLNHSIPHYIKDTCGINLQAICSFIFV